jgi:hypothetical protein
MAMATKRVMVMVTVTRAGEGGGRRNRHWRRRQERLLRRQGWRARNSIQGDVEGNGDVMARPTPTTTFDIRGGGGQRPPSPRAPRVMLGVRGRRDDKTTARRGATRGDATTRRRDETTRGRRSERTTRGRECGVTRRRDGSVTRGDATTSLHD